MYFKKILTGFITVFTATLITCAVVTLLWNLSVHGQKTVDWKTSFRIALAMGIIIPWVAIPRGKHN